jgi:hypothetical protein
MLDIWLETTVKNRAYVRACVCVCISSSVSAKAFFLGSEVQIVTAWEVHHLKM